MNSISLSIPGKVMLAGEYAVLKGGHALAVTVDCKMKIQIIEDPNANLWTVSSNIWNQPKEVSDFKMTENDPLCRAVQSAAKRNHLYGGTVNVHSDMNINYGIGSSSALRLGITAGMNQLRSGPDLSRLNHINPKCIQQAWQLQMESQSFASGYDIATQYAGGLVEFSFEYSENQWRPSWYRHELDSLEKFIHVYVGGEGAPTTSTVQTTNSWLEMGIRTDRLMDLSESLVDSFMQAIRFYSSNSLSNLILSVVRHRNLFAGAPLFPKHIQHALASLPGVDQKWSWKTTGAGGEDALLLIGKDSDLVQAKNELQKLGWSKLKSSFCFEGTILDEHESLQDNLKNIPQDGPNLHSTVNP